MNPSGPMQHLKLKAIKEQINLATAQSPIQTDPSLSHTQNDQSKTNKTPVLSNQQSNVSRMSTHRGEGGEHTSRLANSDCMASKLKEQP